jgi:hypothetical protein
MQPTSQCCKSASATVPVAISDDPFSQMVVLDYYDGPASGFLKCKVCGAEYHFFMLDWDGLHLVRIFALAPVPEGSFQRLLRLLKANPDRRVWIPPVFSRASEEDISDLYDRGIQDVINRAATPSVVIAWSIRAEKALAMRAVDSAVIPHLSPWFDRQPHPVVFDWFGYLRVVKPLQPA